MSCGCGQSFTRQIDLKGHVDLVHIRKMRSQFPSALTNSVVEVVEGDNEDTRSLSLPGHSRTPGSQTMTQCTGFLGCNKTFRDEQDFKAHVRHVFTEAPEIA